jgi:hypothetical protein
METTMTASYVFPNHHPHVDHDAQTVHRPQMTFVPQIDPVPRPANSSPTWKTGWLVSGVAAILGLASLGVVGAIALDALSQSDLAPEVVSTSAPVAPSSGSTVATPAPVLPAPVVTVYPAAPGPAPVANAPRVVMIPGPAAAPAAKEDPVVTPADPVVAPPKPPLGIGTCDLVACDPKPAPPPPGVPHCGDLVACEPIPPAPSIPHCGDLVACTPLPPAGRP